MALTPEDVRNKLFTTVRLREGYEQTEVDEFLDVVEAELVRLLADNKSLRSGAADSVTARGADEGAALSRDSGKPTGTGASTGQPQTAALAGQSAAAAAPAQVVVRTSGEASAAATKLLEMAQRTADQLLTEAQAEAEQLVAGATTTATGLETAARTKADEIDRQTHERTQALERELAEKRQTTLSGMQDQKRTLESEIETLRSFEREYRGRLRSFLEGQLGQLSARTGEDTPLAPSGGPAPRARTGGAAATPAAATPGDQPASSAGSASTSAATPGTGTPGAGTPGTGTPGTGTSTTGTPAENPAPKSALGRILEEEERAGGSA